jgi:hypothetical protein
MRKCGDLRPARQDAACNFNRLEQFVCVIVVEL